MLEFGDEVVRNPVLDSCDDEVKAGQTDAKEEVSFVASNALNPSAESLVYVVQIFIKFALALLL